MMELIDVDSLDFSDNQTWLWRHPEDSGEKVDIVDWILSCDWPNKDPEYLQMEKDLNTMLDNIIKSDFLSLPDKHKFESRNYVEPKRRPQRPSLQTIVEVSSNPSSTSPSPSLHPSLISPMLRLKTFNVDTNTENNTAVKEYAMKIRSLIQDDDPQLEEMNVTEVSGRLSMERTPSKPINIHLSQAAHNTHNTFNKAILNESCESLMRVSPPSLLLVSSLMMESFNPDQLEGVPMSGRDSIDHNHNLTDGNKRALPQEKRAVVVVASSENTEDTGTFRWSSPPVHNVPDTDIDTDMDTAPAPQHYPHGRVTSTPLMSLRKSDDLLNISPIYESLNQTFTVTKAPAPAPGPAPAPVPAPPTVTVSYVSMAPPTQIPRKSSLPTSKLRQYGSHTELSRIPAGIVVSRGRRRYASSPTPSSIAPQQPLLKEDKPVRTVITNPPSAPAPLVRRQGTETLRRETLRPQSQLVASRYPPSSRPYSVALARASQLRVNRPTPTSGPVHRPAQVGVVEQRSSRAASSNEPRLSGLPRPSRLGAPAPAPAPRRRRT